jgi:hypothetical protein
MSLLQKFPSSEFPVIVCEKMVIRPKTTSIKWNRYNRITEVALVGRYGDSIRTSIEGGLHGAVTYYTVTIGTSDVAWVYEINVGGVLHVGLAPRNQVLTTHEGVAVNRVLNTVAGDIIHFTLTSSNTLVIRHNRGYETTRRTYVHDVTAFNGSTLSIWASTSEESLMGVTVLEDLTHTQEITTTGEAVATTTDGKTIVDFDGSAGVVKVEATPMNYTPVADDVESHLAAIDSALGIISGSGACAECVSVDLVPTNYSAAMQTVEQHLVGINDAFGAISTGQIENKTSGATVSIDTDGDIAMTGGVSYKIRAENSVTANVNLALDDYGVRITNTTITTVTLPAAATSVGKKYLIMRAYPTQSGEVWNAPVLSVVAGVGDNIEGDSSVGLFTDTRVELIADTTNSWRIV